MPEMDFNDYAAGDNHVQTLVMQKEGARRINIIWPCGDEYLFVVAELYRLLDTLDATKAMRPRVFCPIKDACADPDQFPAYAAGWLPGRKQRIAIAESVGLLYGQTELVIDPREFRLCMKQVGA